MTDPEFTHGEAVPAPPASPYGQASANRSPARPPLGKREKRGAFWAGAVGFNLLSIGFSLAAAPIAIAVFGAFVSLFANRAAQAEGPFGAGFGVVNRFFDSLDYGILAIIGLVIVVVGLGLMWAGLGASAAILKGHGTLRRWPVTWAGAGIAIVGFWVLGWIPAVLGQVVSAATIRSGGDQFAGVALQGGLVSIGTLALTTIIGWLSWWWMAHAMRRGADDPRVSNEQE
jgi:hypothetical protein